MYCGLREKFRQNPSLLGDLIVCPATLIAECSPYDKVWGTGVGLNSPQLRNYESWPGKNKMGFTLMGLRGDAPRQSNFATPTWQLHNIDHFIRI